MSFGLYPIECLMITLLYMCICIHMQWLFLLLLWSFSALFQKMCNSTSYLITIKTRKDGKFCQWRERVKKARVCSDAIEPDFVPQRTFHSTFLKRTTIFLEWRTFEWSKEPLVEWKDPMNVKSSVEPSTLRAFIFLYHHCTFLSIPT